MRAQVMVLGPAVRELQLHLIDDLLPSGPKRADGISRHIGGYAFDLSVRLFRLELSSGLIATVGNTLEDRQLVSEIRKHGVQTRAIHRGGADRITVRLRTPTQSIEIEPSAPAAPPSLPEIVSALRGARHLHVCPESTARGAVRARSQQALAEARRSGLSTSLSLPDRLDAARSFDEAERRSVFAAVDVLFAKGKVLRSLTGERRLGRAVDMLFGWGVSTVAASLDAGGVRVYGRGEAERIPSFGKEATPSSPAFASGFLLGWLLGSRRTCCGLMGAAAALAGTGERLPNRRGLSGRLGRARSAPGLRKLVPDLIEAQAALSRKKRLPPRTRAFGRS
jgi:sugar/nucleoside kinase (ribokinase family)